MYLIQVIEYITLNTLEQKQNKAKQNHLLHLVLFLFSKEENVDVRNEIRNITLKC